MTLCARAKFANAEPPKRTSPHDATGIHLGIQIATTHWCRINVVQLDILALGMHQLIKDIKGLVFSHGIGQHLPLDLAVTLGLAAQPSPPLALVGKAWGQLVVRPFRPGGPLLIASHKHDRLARYLVFEEEFLSRNVARNAWHHSIGLLHFLHRGNLRLFAATTVGSLGQLLIVRQKIGIDRQGRALGVVRHVRSVFVQPIVWLKFFQGRKQRNIGQIIEIRQRPKRVGKPHAVVMGGAHFLGLPQRQSSDVGRHNLSGCNSAPVEGVGLVRYVRLGRGQRPDEGMLVDGVRLDRSVRCQRDARAGYRMVACVDGMEEVVLTGLAGEGTAVQIEGRGGRCHDGTTHHRQ